MGAETETEDINEDGADINEDLTAILTHILSLIDPKGKCFKIAEDPGHHQKMWLAHKSEDIFIDVEDGKICVNDDSDGKNQYIDISEPGALSKEKLDRAIKDFLIHDFRGVFSDLGNLRKAVDAVEKSDWEGLLDNIGVLKALEKAVNDMFEGGQ